MSGKVASLIALVPMLFHSIFGCCWHHVHILPVYAQVTVAVADEAPVCTPSRRSCCGHAHGSSPQVSEEVALVGQAAGEPQSSEPPPCEEEDCAVDLGVVIANHSEKISFEARDFFPSSPNELRLIDQLPGSVWCGVIERSLPDSAREHCAITQVWRV